MLESKVGEYLLQDGNISVSGVGVNQNKLKMELVEISGLCKYISGDLLGWVAVSVARKHSLAAPVLERRRPGGGEQEPGHQEDQEE